jgi:hypothetical protein
MGTWVPDAYCCGFAVPNGGYIPLFLGTVELHVPSPHLRPFIDDQKNLTIMIYIEYLDLKGDVR